MGEVVNIADRFGLKSTKSVVLKYTSAESTDDEELPEDSPEGSALYNALSANGITILNDESLRDFRTVMKLVRGMKDRQAGKADSEDCIMLECLGQALGYSKDVIPDDSFDDLLDKLN